MVSRSKYKRVPDLYVVGTEVVLKDGTVMWVQVPNPFEYDECRHDAQVARARIIMSIKESGEELDKLQGAYHEHGREAVVQDLVDHKAGQFLLKAVDDIRADPDWKERLEILDRSEELIARVPEDAERKLLVQLSEDYQEEIGKRLTDETTFLTGQYEGLDEESLWAEFRDYYAERRASDVATAEYKITEMWYATRCCDGVQVDGQWDHSACEGHELRVYEDKAEVRSLPLDMQRAIYQALQLVSMTERDARFSDRQGSSSESSPLPSEPAVSTPSTPIETPVELPGTSLSPSATP